MGSISKCPPNKDGSVSWKAEARDGSGKRRTKRLASRRLAKAWVTDTEAHMQRTKGVLRGVLFRDALIRYRDKVAPTKKGAKWEINRCNSFCREDIADIPLVQMSIEDAERHMFYRSATVKNDSIIREMTLAKVVLRHCRRWYGLTEYPWAGLKMPKAAKPRDRLITEEEVGLIISAANYDIRYTPLTKTQCVAAMFLFAVETGMRQGEIAGLTPNMLDLVDRVATLPASLTKTDEKREVPLSGVAMDVIASLPDCAPDTPVFTVSAGSASALFINLRRAAGIPEPKDGGFRFHDARHLACTRLAAIPGIDVLDLARIIGHTDINQLRTYFNESAATQAKKLAQHERMRFLEQGDGAAALRAVGYREEEIARMLKAADRAAS